MSHGIWCGFRTPGQHVTKSSRFLGVAIRGVGVSLARPIRMILDRLASRIADAQIPAVLTAILDRSVEAIGPGFRTSKPARSLAKNCPRVTRLYVAVTFISFIIRSERLAIGMASIFIELRAPCSGTI